MGQQFLLFVISILLVVIFWELCKINGLLKKTRSSTHRISKGKQTNEADTTNILV